MNAAQLLDTKRLRKAAIATLFAATALVLWPPAAAAEPQHEAGTTVANLALLERTFWTCDFVATRYGMEDANASNCLGAYEEWKAARFGGDFDALLAWWRENRDSEHAALERKLAKAGPRLAKTP